MYSYVLVPKNLVNENNFFRYVERPTGSFDDNDHFIINVAQAIDMGYEDNQIKIKFFENDTFDTETNSFVQGDSKQITSQFETDLKSHDLMIVRHKVNKDTQYEDIDGEYYVDSVDDLMFVIRNTKNAIMDNIELSLLINHYRIR